MMKRICLALALLLLPGPALAQSAPLILKSGKIAQAGSSDAIKVAVSPAFSNSVYSSGFQGLVNGASPGTLYSSQQGGQQATEAVTGAINVSVGAAVHQTSAIAGYVISNRAQPGNGGDVAGYFQAGCNANNCAAFAINPVSYDTVGKTGQILDNEFDFNRSATDTTVNGVNLVLNSVGSPTGNANGFSCRTVFGTGQWNNCNVVADGAVSQYSYFIGATSSGPSADTQPLGLVSYKSDGSRYIATILGDRFGGLDLRPGGTGGSVAFQDAGGANNASVNSTALTSNVPVILKSYTVATLPTCNSGLKGGMAYVTDASAPTYNGALTGGGGVNVPVFCNGAAWSSH